MRRFQFTQPLILTLLAAAWFSLAAKHIPQLSRRSPQRWTFLKRRALLPTLPAASSTPEEETILPFRFCHSLRRLFPTALAIPVRHTCSGEDLSPALEWDGDTARHETPGADVEDPDAPAGNFHPLGAVQYPAGAAGAGRRAFNDATLPRGSACRKRAGLAAAAMGTLPAAW